LITLPISVIQVNALIDPRAQVRTPRGRSAGGKEAVSTIWIIGDPGAHNFATT